MCKVLFIGRTFAQYILFLCLQTKADIAYANSKGIEVGGYDLIVLSRTVPSYWMDVGGDGACIASGW